MKKLFSAAVVLISIVMLSACGGGGGGAASYTVGGSVSGLTGSGLVLQNNGADDLAVSADGAFTFATAVADGGAYLVTVKTQPSGQTCTASSNSGTIAGANITNVSVVCSTNTYTVGGSVSGLSGSGLVLQNNSSDDLAVSANGAFTFATAVADGSAYLVTVKTQPSGPTQTCTASNNSGTVAGSNVTNVSVVCSTNAYTVGGTVSGLAGSGLVLQNNAGDDLSVASGSTLFTFATKVADGAGYTVTVKTQPTNPVQKCVVGSGTGTVSGADVTNVSISCTTAFLNLSNFQTASVVIGQPTFTTGVFNQGGTAGANTINGPYGDPVVYNGMLYLPDTGNSRVLGFNSVPTVNNKSADFVLGEPDITTIDGGTSDKLMSYAQTVRAYNGKLFVADYNNSRILIWNSAPTTTQAAANVVVGNTDFNSVVSGCTSTTLNYPESMFVVDGKLIVADSSNNRVLIWNSIPSSNGAAADLVLGQNSFTTCAENDDNQDGTADTAPTARTLYYPSDIWSDGVRLIITDHNNNRVLIWSAFPTINQAPADIVLGQPGMTSSVVQLLSNKSLRLPYFLTSNGNQLFVSDYQNHRVMIWNSIPTTDYAPADRVLGQGDFVHNYPNDDDQNSVSDTNPTARTLSDPTGLYVFDDKLIVGELGNNRYLIFQGQ